MTTLLKRKKKRVGAVLDVVAKGKATLTRTTPLRYDLD